MFRDIRPPMFGGAFAAAVVCAIALAAFAVGFPYVLQQLTLGAMQ